MVGNHAHGETDQAGRIAGHIQPESRRITIKGAIGAHLEPADPHVAELIGGIHIAGDQFDCHVARLQAIESHRGLEEVGLADLHSGGQVHLDAGHCDPRPSLAHLVFPMSQLFGYVALRDPARRSCCRGVELGDVVADHPGGHHLGTQTRDRAAHHPHPLGWDAVLVTGVEHRDDFAFDDLVKGLGFGRIPLGLVTDHLGRGNGPAVRRVIQFVPPTVLDGQVEGPVQGGLHARGAAGLHRAQRVVQPHVAARVERLSQGHVIVGQEDHLAADVLLICEKHHLLDQSLADFVGGMCLACDDDLDRGFRVV